MKVFHGTYRSKINRLNKNYKNILVLTYINGMLGNKLNSMRGIDVFEEKHGVKGSYKGIIFTNTKEIFSSRQFFFMKPFKTVHVLVRISIFLFSEL